MMTLDERRFVALAETLLAGNYAVARVDYVPARGTTVTHGPLATQAQMGAALVLVAGWPWTQSAEDQYQLAKAREQARQRGTRGDDIGIGVRAAFWALLDAVNQLRAFHNLPPVTKADAEAARLAKINAGEADG